MDDDQDALLLGVRVIESASLLNLCRPALALGKHTTQVLGEIGYSGDELERLRAADVIGGQ